MRRVPRTSPTKAIYSMEIKDDLILIVDSKQGRSVTNDAENVIADLADRGVLVGRRVLYRDTEDRWDELKHDGRYFTGFAPVANMEEALNDPAAFVDSMVELTPKSEGELQCSGRGTAYGDRTLVELNQGRTHTKIELEKLVDHKSIHLSEMLRDVSEDSYGTRAEISKAQEFLVTLRAGLDSTEPIDLTFDSSEYFTDDPSDMAHLKEDRDLHHSALSLVNEVTETFERLGYAVKVDHARINKNPVASARCTLHHRLRR